MTQSVISKLVDKVPMWDVFRAGRWVGMAEGRTEEDALAHITLDPDRGPYKVIRWYGRLDSRNCVTSGGTIPDPV